MDDMTKIVIVDDHDIIIHGLKALLSKRPGFDVVGEASNGKEGIELVKELNPDIVISDVHMPELNGLELAGLVKEYNSNIKVLILSVSKEEANIFKAVRSSVDGYLLKESPKEEYFTAINTLMNDKKYFSPVITEVMMSQYIKNVTSEGAKPREAKEVLTNRETQILRLVVEGMTSAAIGKKLVISPTTVKTHRANIMDKLNVKNSAELVAKTHKMNLV